MLSKGLNCVLEGNDGGSAIGVKGTSCRHSADDVAWGPQLKQCGG